MPESGEKQATTLLSAMKARFNPNTAIAQLGAASTLREAANAVRKSPLPILILL